MAIYDGYHGGVSMPTTYSIAEARNQFAALIRQVQEGETAVRVTRRGEPVAVILSQQEYEALSARPPQKDFWTAYLEWREKWDVDNMDIDPDDIWGDIRDRTPVPDSNPWL
jgi:prevent-host-death family protein